MSESSPPPMPSPEFIPSPLPSPPFATNRRFDPPPIKCNTSFPRNHESIDTDEFGATRNSPRSLSLPSPLSSKRRSHRQSLSFAIPYRSPPPSPTIASPPPPVPPIPAFALSPSDKKPVIHSSQPLPPSSSSSPSSSSPEPSSPGWRKQARSTTKNSRVKNSTTCMEFFSMRNTTPRDVARTATA